MSGVVILGGADALAHPGDRVQQAGELGLPHPGLLVRASGAVMVIGGLALGLGIHPRWAAAGVLAALGPSTVAEHPFWTEDGPARAESARRFAANVGLAGGLLAILGGPSRTRSRARS